MSHKRIKSNLYLVQDGNQTKELEKMKIHEIVEGYYDASPFAQKMAKYGRRLMQMGQGSGEPGSLAKMSDEELGMMNKMGSLGSALSKVGTPFGIKDPSENDGVSSPKQRLAKFFAELEKASGCDKAMCMKLLKKAEAAGDIKSKVPDPEPQDDGDDEPEDKAPSDDEIDRDAVAFAKG
jgi:hypothetical protein